MGMTTLLTLTAMFSSVSSTCLLYSHFWLTFNSHEIPPWHWKTTFNIVFTLTAMFSSVSSTIIVSFTRSEFKTMWNYFCMLCFYFCLLFHLVTFNLPNLSSRLSCQMTATCESENGIFLVGQAERMYLGVQHPCHRKTNSKHHLQTRKTTFGPTFFLQSLSIEVEFTSCTLCPPPWHMDTCLHDLCPSLTFCLNFEETFTF